MTKTTTGTWTYANHLAAGIAGSGALANTQAINAAITLRTISEPIRARTSAPGGVCAAYFVQLTTRSFEKL